MHTTMSANRERKANMKKTPYFSRIWPCAILVCSLATVARGFTGTSQEFSVDLSGTGPWETRTAAPHELLEYSARWAASAPEGAVSVVKVCTARTDKPAYLAIDLSGGPTAVRWPVETFDTPPSGGWGDEYRTEKLVLHRIPAGSFRMGVRAGDFPGAETDLREATIGRDFYIGVFEVTQRQWELAMGPRPSCFSNDNAYATRPVESVSYADIRGAHAGLRWPDTRLVDEASFLGRLRGKTGLAEFDLPTETQWEYACRAGSETALNTGEDLYELPHCLEMEISGRYGGNSGWFDGCEADPAFTANEANAGTAKAGDYPANAWGLYDMHGNVAEWCLDAHSAAAEGGTDPVGPVPATIDAPRLHRGGAWNSDNARDCASGVRHAEGRSPADRAPGIGFRLCYQDDKLPAFDRSLELANDPGPAQARWTPWKADYHYLIHQTLAGDSEASDVLAVWFGAGGTGEAPPPEPTLSIAARQRYPWNGLVDIDLVVGGDPGTPCNAILGAKNTADGTPLPLATLRDADGTSVSPSAPLLPGTHRLVWDAAADLPDGFECVAVSVTGAVSRAGGAGPVAGAELLYMVIDLSGGPDADAFPVSYATEEPAGGWPEEYKTTKLVLRLVHSDSYAMGSPETELGRLGLRETLHDVTLTRPAYLGVFEVTQKQWELVAGTAPSLHPGDARPVEQVAYATVRGASAGAAWPADDAVDPDSFLGILRARTGIPFDLPTEAVWEYACRAGTTNALNNGKELTGNVTCTNLALIARYSGNQTDNAGGFAEAHTTVGSYAPNAWGFYDMHGNVAEWCLDWYAEALEPATDPVGPDTGAYRTTRGGGWSDRARSCRSACRDHANPDDASPNIGFRIGCFAGMVETE